MRPKSTWFSPLDAWCAGSNVSRPGLPLSLLSGLGHELLRAQRSAGSSHQAGRRWVGSGLGNRFEPVTHLGQLNLGYYPPFSFSPETNRG
ncbi:hypothetical protein V6N11_056818 [Hibiscus sabdariffa]|uniref:Uncharacterized protein n=1 Tax=Hibiscus sabdariffa TaxID=183260 RepID=A0ABR2T5X1_9ROSI